MDVRIHVGDRNLMPRLKQQAKRLERARPAACMQQQLHNDPFLWHVELSAKNASASCATSYTAEHTALRLAAQRAFRQDL